MDGIGEKLVEQLLDSDLIKNLADLYKLEKHGFDDILWLLWVTLREKWVRWQQDGPKGR